jgi:hypothetical protein
MPVRGRFAGLAGPPGSNAASEDAGDTDYADPDMARGVGVSPAAS